MFEGFFFPDLYQTPDLRENQFGMSFKIRKGKHFFKCTFSNKKNEFFFSNK